MIGGTGSIGSRGSHFWHGESGFPSGRLSGMSTPLRSRFRPRYRTLVLLMAMAVIFWSGFSYWSEYRENAARLARERLAPPLGIHCQILFSGAELGTKNMPPTPATANSAENSISGQIVDQSDRWIVLAPHEEAPTTRIWIPRERILLIRVD